MEKVRIMGPRELLEAVMDALQELGTLHLDPPEPAGPMRELEPPPGVRREARHLESVLEDLEWCLDRLDAGGAEARKGASAADVGDFARWARRARDVRRRLGELEARRRSLTSEQNRLRRYLRFADAFESLLPEPTGGKLRSYELVLPSGEEAALEPLREALREAVDDGFELRSARTSAGELAAVMLVPREVGERIDALLEEAGIEELPVPEAYRGDGLSAALPAMRRRLREIDAETEEVEAERRALSRDHGDALLRARGAVRDRLLELEAMRRVGETARAFVVEGWVPRAAGGRLREELDARFGDSIAVETVSREEWEAEEAPVVLSNPRLFRPFEAVTRVFPLPRYGTIDPTPFVAVFFPMFFGVILGDVGYGLVLAGVAAWLHHRSDDATTLRSVSEIAGACAAFTVLFGGLYGELFGDLPRRLLGLHGLFRREEALMGFLAFAVALGLVHVLLGLVLGAVTEVSRNPRHALGRGVSALMIVLVAVALLAAGEVLPAAFFTPAVIALLVAFPVLIAAEGILAPVELLSTLGNVLSYARIMALGTASVVMAVVANRMVGTVGGVVVGALFGLLFHLVNFVLGVFGPTVHALRLHYVEFFGTFYSSGGVRYRPFARWRPDRRPTPETEERGSPWTSSG